MSGNIEIANTNEARNCCQTLDAGIAYYENLITELTNAKGKIQTNWEGDSAALNDVITRIDSTITVFDATIRAAKGLSQNVVAFADKIDEVSNNTVENNNGSQPSGVENPGNGSVPSTTPNQSVEKENPASYSIWSGGFWKNIGQDFCDDWDFSDTHGLVSGIGDVAGGVLNTAGSVVNTVGRVVGGLIDWIFG